MTMALYHRQLSGGQIMTFNTNAADPIENHLVETTRGGHVQHLAVAHEPRGSSPRPQA